MTNSDDNIIYIEMIDGTTCWVPTKAQLIDGNKFLILDNDYFDEDDTLILPEFIPGDTVGVVEHLFSDKTNGLLAKTLLKSSDNPSKKLFEFLFKATKQTLPIDTETKSVYLQQIQYIKERQLANEFFYPAILDTIKKFDNL